MAPLLFVQSDSEPNHPHNLWLRARDQHEPRFEFARVVVGTWKHVYTTEPVVRQPIDLVVGFVGLSKGQVRSTIVDQRVHFAQVDNGKPVLRKLVDAQSLFAHRIDETALGEVNEMAKVGMKSRENRGSQKLSSPATEEANDDWTEGRSH